MTRMLASFLLGFLLFSSPTQSADLPKTDPKVIAQLKAYLQSHYMTPEDYVISKFQDHDVIFLGEHHRYKHVPELVQALIPRAYEKGVYTLAMEFARHEDQGLIDRLINAPTYDEALARQIMFNFSVYWGYQEYVDVFKSAWGVNHTLPSGKRKFRILGLNCSEDWSVIQTEADQENPQLRAKVFGDCDEDWWAKIIFDEVVAKGEKALVYTGMHHAFTEYSQPLIQERDGKQIFSGFIKGRFGNYVYRRIGKRAFTVSLHQPWVSSEGYDKPETYAADGYIDAVMGQMESKLRTAGFDMSGTPFGNLPGEMSLYKYGYERFTLATFCDGYVIQGPLAEYKGVTPIKDFINPGNLAQARAQMPNPKFRHATAEEMNRAIAEDVERQLGLSSAMHVSNPN